MYALTSDLFAVVPLASAGTNEVITPVSNLVDSRGRLRCMSNRGDLLPGSIRNAITQGNWLDDGTRLL
jgi:hypothetical protein